MTKIRKSLCEHYELNERVIISTAVLTTWNIVAYR